MTSSLQSESVFVLSALTSTFSVVCKFIGHYT